MSAPAFELPDSLVAAAPPEARGLARDSVRLMVAGPGGIEHRVASALPAILRAGDVLVLNTSETLPAALRGVTGGGEPVEIHLSTVDRTGSYADALAGTRSGWVVEVRRAGPLGGEQSYQDRTGVLIRLAGGGTLRVDGSAPVAGSAHSRLWSARITTPAPLLPYLREHGEPIRYRYVSAPWPLSAYRNEYADTPGSVELPSAGRAITRRMLRRLRARGIQLGTLTLHCGVSSVESADPPYPEWFEVPPATADVVNEARWSGRRVIAVGTTVVRALESVAEPRGFVRPGSGWTDLVVAPARGVSTVDGLLTGWHEPQASHHAMLAAVASPELIHASYQAALSAGYLWHEFGDLHLLLRDHRPKLA
jgi:S-adenosylmethionine:tRNA ribosyltransferase-isomerase